MASSYPGSLDSLATTRSDSTPAQTTHAQDHNDLADAVNKIEAELGTLPKGTSATVKARLDALRIARVRVRQASAQSIPNGTWTALVWDTEVFDTDAMHFTSAANLTGTVQKTASSNALVGTGTAFTTELSVGQVIDVPGTAVERAVVTAITDDTHLTVATNFANSASGQTATRVNSVLVASLAGVYTAGASVGWAGGSGKRGIRAILNNDPTLPLGVVENIGTGDSSSNAGTPINIPVVELNQWDYIEYQVQQFSGAGLNTLVGSQTTTTASMARIGPL